jgi:hypothetical protein
MTKRNSSLTLAIVLFLHSVFSIIYASFLCVMFFERRFRKVYEFLPFYRFLDDLCTFLWIAIEYYRLRVGKSANLTENIKKMAIFLIMTIFPQVSMVLGFGFLVKESNFYSKVFSIISILFLLFELIEGGRVMRKIMQSQTLKFYK